MLVLSRKAGEAVFIGEEVTVKVLSVESSGRVKLGIEAPKDVLVVRDELYKPAGETCSE